MSVGKKHRCEKYRNDLERCLRNILYMNNCLASLKVRSYLENGVLDLIVETDSRAAKILNTVFSKP